MFLNAHFEENLMPDSLLRIDPLAPGASDDRFLDVVGSDSSSSLLRIAKRVYEEELIMSSRSVNRKEKMREVHILLPESLFVKAKEMASIQGMSLAELVRRSLAQGLGHEGYHSIGGNISEELRVLREEIKELKEWKRQMEIVASEKQEIGAAASSASVVVTPPRSSGSSMPASSKDFSRFEGRPSGASRSRSSLSRSDRRSPYEAWVLEVMQSDAGRPWHWREVLSRLEELGYGVKFNTLKDRMNKMSKEGLILKVDRGTYRLP